jgi:hypothetical protein
MESPGSPEPKRKMQARRRAKPSAEGVNLDELLASSESGAYEALQLFRSRAQRFLTKGENMVALRTTVEGAVKLIRGGYFAAATELCSQLVDILNKTEADITNSDIREIVFNVDDAFVQAVESRTEDITESSVENTKTIANAFKSRKEFLKGCVKWSQTSGPREYGDPALNLRLASALWVTDNQKATYHYVVGEAPAALSQKISDTFGGKDADHVLARDRALTLGVCHFLALENLRDANELVIHFKKAQKNRGNNVETKLVTFCSQLLECCRRDAAPLFKQLVNTVVPDISGWGNDMVPTLVQGPIACKFFNMQPKVHPMMQMMQQFLA